MTIAQELDKNKNEIIKQTIEGASYRSLARLYNCDIKDIYLFYQRHLDDFQEASTLASYQHLSNADDYADEIDDDATAGRIARNREKIKLELFKAKIKNRLIFDDNYKNRGVDKDGKIIVIPSDEVLKMQQQLNPPIITLKTDAFIINNNDELEKAKQAIEEFEQYNAHIDQAINN